MQAGTFDLVGTIVYEIDQLPYQNTFYNGTIEVTEAGGLVSVETVFLVSLGISLLVFLGLWVRGQVQNLSKVLLHINEQNFMVFVNYMNARGGKMDWLGGLGRKLTWVFLVHVETVQVVFVRNTFCPKFIIFYNIIMSSMIREFILFQ